MYLNYAYYIRIILR